MNVDRFGPRQLRAAVQRALAFVARSRHERDMTDELESHLQLHIDDNVRAGMAPAEARRDALVRLGGMGAARELYRDRRGAPVLDAIAQDVRYALRELRRKPLIPVVAVLTLALGIGANTAIFSLIDSVMLKSLPVAHPEELLHVTPAYPGHASDDDQFTNPAWEQLRDRQDVFIQVFAYGLATFNLVGGGEIRWASGQYVSGQFFEALGLRATVGRTLSVADDTRGCPATAVLSDRFWRADYAGQRDVIGRTISLEGHPFEVVGVLEPGFTGVTVGNAIDVYAPICAEAIVRGNYSVLNRLDNWWLHVIGRTRPGVSVGQATARLQILAPAIFAATAPPHLNPQEQAAYLKRSFEAWPVATGLSYIRVKYQTALEALIVVTTLVLLVACANVANLLLARGTSRQREIAVRIALGITPRRLLRQLLTESLLLSLTGAGLGVFLAHWAVALPVRLLSSVNDPIVLDLALDSRTLAFTAAVAILTAMLFGLAPAWRATRIDPQSALKAKGRGLVEGGRFGLSQALVVAQVALSFVLVAGAMLMLSTFFTLATSSPGFDRHVLLARVDIRGGHYPADRVAPAFDEILERLRALPGVRAASSSELTPISGSSWTEVLQIDGAPSLAASDREVFFNRVSGGFFNTLDQPLAAGRDFGIQDTRTSPRVGIVNQTMARRFFGGGNPIGMHYRVESGTRVGPWVEIVGVVADAKYRSLREQPPPTAYVPITQTDAFYTRTFEVRGVGDPATLVPGLRSAIETGYPDVSFELSTLADQLDHSISRERLLATLSGFFGALAVLLAAIGLYGILSYGVARRRNEIGVRMALGAGSSAVRRLILGEAFRLVGAGLVAGLAATVACTRFLGSFLYGVTTSDPRAVAISVTALASVALIAAYVPARRASGLDPLSALKEE